MYQAKASPVSAHVPMFRVPTVLRRVPSAVPQTAVGADFGMELLHNSQYLRAPIDVLKVTKCFVWIREKAPKPRMVLNFFPVSLPKFTTLRDLTLARVAAMEPEAASPLN